MQAKKYLHLKDHIIMRLLILIFYLTFNIAGYNNKQADDYIVRGVEKFKLKDYTGAINEFTKSI